MISFQFISIFIEKLANFEVFSLPFLAIKLIAGIHKIKPKNLTIVSIYEVWGFGSMMGESTGNGRKINVRPYFLTIEKFEIFHFFQKFKIPNFFGDKD